MPRCGRFQHHTKLPPLKTDAGRHHDLIYIDVYVQTCTDNGDQHLVTVTSVVRPLLLICLKTQNASQHRIFEASYRKQSDIGASGGQTKHPAGVGLRGENKKQEGRSPHTRSSTDADTSTELRNIQIGKNHKAGGSPLTFVSTTEEQTGCTRVYLHRQFDNERRHSTTTHSEEQTCMRQ